MLDESGIHGEVVVTDDGSLDRTGAILARLAGEDARVRVVSLTTNQGYGTALRSAIAAARGEIVVTIDADGQFDPSDIPRLLALRCEGHHDLVNGARRAKSDTPLRIAADLALRVLVRALFGLRLRDPNCARKVARRDWLARADLRADGFATPTELVVRAAHDGHSMAELTVAHHPRAGGRSKLSVLRTGVQTARFLLALRVRLARRV